MTTVAPVAPCLQTLSRPMPWRLRLDPARSGADNMRLDEELLEGQKNPGAMPVLRIFRWKHPTLSYGRLQDPAWAAERAKVLGAKEIVRRPTGGGTVLHDRDVSLSLVWRRDHAGFPKCLKNIYRAVHEAAQAALKQAGVETTLYVPASKRSGGQGFCFVEPAEDDVMRGDRKVVGGALKVTGWARLYQGNVTVADGLDMDFLAKLLPRTFEQIFFGCSPSLP